MKIGIVSTGWPPRGGGAEVYVRRLACALAARGHRIEAAVGSPAGEVTGGGVELFQAPAVVDADDPASCRAWYRHLEPWLTGGGFDVVLVNAPLTRVSHDHARELFDAARRHAGRVGALFFDLGRTVASELSWAYAMAGSWDGAAERVLERAREHLRRAGDARGYHDLESPLFFRPDFVLSCSAWSDRFVDPLGALPRAVLHPLLDPTGPGGGGDGAGGEPLASVTASFMNPLPHKGLDRFVEIVRKAPADWTFRVLAGGYGRGLERLQEAFGGTGGPPPGRIETVGRVPEIGPFYRATGFVLVPSLYEGYGLAAVEPMLHGTPVVASAYPAILEGVGEGAATLPFTASAGDWVRQMETVLSEREAWAERGRRRAAHLLERQERELDTLVEFLGSMSRAGGDRRRT